MACVERRRAWLRSKAATERMLPHHAYTEKGRPGGAAGQGRPGAGRRRLAGGWAGDGRRRPRSMRGHGRRGEQRRGRAGEEGHGAEDGGTWLTTDTGRSQLGMVAALAGSQGDNDYGGEVEVGRGGGADGELGRRRGRRGRAATGPEQLAGGQLRPGRSSSRCRGGSLRPGSTGRGGATRTHGRRRERGGDGGRR